MRKLSLLALVLGLAACRGGDGDDGDDTPNPDSSVNGSDVTIQEIQNDAMVPGTPVNLKGVIVTAIDNYGMRTGDFWIQEPGGGEYSGVQVFGAPLDQVAALAVGDVVDISGAQKEEFALSSDMSGNTLTELEPLNGGMITVTKVSSGTAPAPQMVDALAIGQLTDFMARHAEWEKWEGVPVTLTNVQAMSDAECITSMGNCNDMTYRRFDLTGDIQAQSGLAEMPATVDRGDCFASITGIVTYFFDYQINPRTAAEFATGGTGCATENTMATCGDTIDNDGNGFTDCEDNQCIAAASTCRATTTISAIQTAATPPSGGVELNNVVVAAISKNLKNMWVQTNLTAAPNEGIYVRGDGSDITFTVGQRVSIIGTIDEFNDSSGTETLTQLRALSIAAGTGTTGTVVPVTGTAAAAMATESYESTLVTLTNVKVTAVGTTQGTGHTFGVGDAVQSPGGTLIKTDDDMHLLGTLNACYATITGIWQYLPFNNSWGFLPLSAGTGTGTCN